MCANAKQEGIWNDAKRGEKKGKKRMWQNHTCKFTAGPVENFQGPASKKGTYFLPNFLNFFEILY